MTDAKNGAEWRYDAPKDIALGFGHVEGRIDDIEVALISALEKIATGITAEELLAALDALCEALPTMKAHRTVA